MKKWLFLGAVLALISTSVDVNAQQRRRPVAASRGVFSGISGSTVAVGVGVVAAIAAIALIANNSTSHSH